MSQGFAPGLSPKTELAVQDTHRIGLWPKNRLIAQSAGRGWRDVYVALATVNGWSGMLAPTGHPCIAYCMHRPAHLSRRIDGVRQRESATVRPRQFFVIPGHQATEWHRHGSSDMLMLYLRQDMLDRMAGELAGADVSAVAIDLGLGATDPLLEQLALSILRTLQTPEDGGSALYVDGLVHAMAGHLLRNHSHVGTRRPEASHLALTPALSRIPALIEARLGEDMSLACLAREAGLSPTVFARSFARAFGVTVHQYVLQRRVEEAKRLLSSTDMAVVEIALQTGFSSQSHLATAFKKMTSITPGHYRAGPARCAR